MFGTLRLALALGVVLAHLGWRAYVGQYSVFAFYTISGFLMCLVLDRRYGFSWRGFGGYALNRFLRIFPPYLAACALSVLMLWWFGNPKYGVLWYAWSMPDTAAEWISNLSIFGLSTGPGDRLVAPAWALRVELFYYLALAAGLGRGPRIALAWAGAATLWHVHLQLRGAGPIDYYYAIPAASLPFSLGACAYHFRDQIARRVRRPALAAGVTATAWLANVVIAGAMQRGASPLHFYLSCALGATLIALLALPLGLPARVARADARLGDLSYPIYLVHMQIGFWLATVIGLSHHGMPLFFCALPAVVGAGWAMLRLVDDPVEALRGRVRDAFDRTRESGATTR